MYGEPVTQDGATAIPVARVGFGFGDGAGRETGSTKTAEGGGGGGGAEARPLGFIEIKDGTATYKPIRDLWADIALPLTALLAGIIGSKSACHQRHCVKCLFSILSCGLARLRIRKVPVC